MSDATALSVPLHLHRIAFTSAGFLAVRAFCQGCGWTIKGVGSQSDAVYWKAREHLNEVRVGQVSS